MSTKGFSVISDSDSINNIEENTQTLLKSYRDIGLEINPEETKYFLMARHQNAGQIYTHLHNNSL
jgi:hypothetical protein